MENLQSFQTYLIQWKEIQHIFLTYFDDDTKEEDNFQNIAQSLNAMKVKEDPYKLKMALHLLLKINKNHQYSTSMNSKTMKIILTFKEQILQFYSSDEIFHIFSKNKSIFLLVLQEKLLIPSINNASFVPHNNFVFSNYTKFFYPEFHQFYDKYTLDIVCRDADEFNKNIDKEFYQKRQIGQNPLPLCELIRKDDIDQFVSFITVNNIVIRAEDVKYSIFETNIFLYQSKVTLIDYAAFFGSVQILKYLLLHGCSLRDETWFFAIHGNNNEIIQILEESKINPPDNDYMRCVNEAIKCHHNELANYIYSNHVEDTDANSKIMQKRAIDSFNFEFFPTLLDNSPKLLYEFCKKDYYDIVKVLLKTNQYDINLLIIFL